MTLSPEASYLARVRGKYDNTQTLLLFQVQWTHYLNDKEDNIYDLGHDQLRYGVSSFLNHAATTGREHLRGQIE